MDLRVWTERVGDALVVRVVGDLDVATEPTFTTFVRRLSLAGLPVLVVDLRGVTFLDARGLGALVRLRRRVNRHAGRLGLLAPPRTLRLLQLTHLDVAFDVFDTVEDATAPPACSPDG